MKHSKYKNTGILFELLIRQVTNDTINGVRHSPAIKIIREFFKKSTSLKKELGLYQMLTKEKFNSESKANRFVDAVLKERKKLPKSVLRKQKYNLIKEIKKNYNLEDFFKTKVGSYLDNASIYYLFEGNIPSKLVKYIYKLVENITNKKVIKNKTNETYDLYSQQDKDVRLLSYKILLEKFNDKYGDLNKKQKSLLKEYIENISNTNKLKDYLHKEINKTSKNLEILCKKVNEDVIKIKLNEVIAQLKNIKEDKDIKDKYIISILRAYDLIKELVHVVK